MAPYFSRYFTRLLSTGSTDPASMINASYIDPTAPAAQADLGLGNPAVDLNKWFLSIQTRCLGHPVRRDAGRVTVGPHA